MMRASKYSAEVRERAVRLVRDHASEYESQWAAIRSIAEKAGVRVTTLAANLCVHCRLTSPLRSFSWSELRDQAWPDSAGSSGGAAREI